MHSVIVGQHVSSRRKPVRIIADSSSLDIRPRTAREQKPVSRRKTGLLSRRKPAHRLDPKASLLALADTSLASAGRAGPPSGSRGSLGGQSILRVSLLASAVLLVAMSLVAVLGPVFRPGQPSLGQLTMPGDELVENLILEAILAYEAEDETAIIAPLPMVLDTFDYRVAANDTLDAISRRYNVRVETLISLNSIRDVRRLQLGTVLKIPNIDGILYTVRSGDSLSAIARTYSKSIYDLVDANDLASQTLSPGQVLFIPGARMPTNDLRRALGTLVIWPIQGRISSGYGYRNSPITGVRQFHSGIDIVAAENSPVRAAIDGRVVETGYSAVYGNFVIMSHFDGYQTLYAHLNRISVRTGQTVSQGGTLGLLGSTGMSTGPHLHFGVYRNGLAVNPLTLLQR